MTDAGGTTRVETTHDYRVMRASDAERDATVVVLQDAVSRGLLTPHEGSERMAAAFAAVYRADLPTLTADLPPADPRVRARSWNELATKTFELASYFVARAATSARARPLRALVVLLVVLVSVCVLGPIFSQVWFGSDGGRHGGAGFGRSVGRHG